MRNNRSNHYRPQHQAPRKHLTPETTIERCAVHRKVIFGSKKEARQFARQIEHLGERQYPYTCPDCGSWHLTSIPQN